MWWKANSFLMLNKNLVWAWPLNETWYVFVLDFFTSLLDDSKEDLHSMFTRTYGILYEQNSYIFMDLFRDLREYYKGRDMNLLDVLDKFFSDLLERMFVLLHSDHEFDDNYLECITNHMSELRPFGDVPAKMSGQVKKSFIAARTFVQGLQVGRDVIIALSRVCSLSSHRYRFMSMSNFTCANSTCASDYLHARPV